LREDFLIGESVCARRFDRGPAELLGLGSFAGVAIQLRQCQASFGSIALISQLLLQRESLKISRACFIRFGPLS
jgi:hypothetical protein